MPRPSIWKGQSGFLKAQEVFIDYWQNHGNIPAIRKFRGLENAINQKYWTQYGIFSRNDFILSCKLKPNLLPLLWGTPEGYLRARNIILNYVLIRGHVPINKEVQSIAMAASRGAWKTPHDVSSYNEFLIHLNLTPNSNRVYSWKSSGGFELAKRIALNFYFT